MGVSGKSDVRGDVKVPQGTMALRVQGYLEMLCSMIGCGGCLLTAVRL